MTAENERSSEELERQVGRLLASLREEQGVSQAALALDLGHDQSYVSRLERGERRLTVAELMRCAAALGVSYARLAADLERIYGDLVETRSIWERERG
jgi:transcriptional regulator with XRE-family HTH domain